MNFNSEILFPIDLPGDTSANNFLLTISFGVTVVNLNKMSGMTKKEKNHSELVQKEYNSSAGTISPLVYLLSKQPVSPSPYLNGLISIFVIH